MVILTGDQMRAAEKLAVEDGTSFEQLMENAGNGAAQAMIRRFGELLVPGANILILLDAETMEETVWSLRGCCSNGSRN